MLLISKPVSTAHYKLYICFKKYTRNELRIRLINSGINCSKAKRQIALTVKLKRIMDLMACVLMGKSNLLHKTVISEKNMSTIYSSYRDKKVYTLAVHKSLRSL